MPTCSCGFSFTKGHLKGRRIESYATIRDRDYLKVMRKERVIFSERKPDKRLALIGDVAQWVGNLMRCPQCGAWLFLKPQQGKASPVILLKPAPFTQGRSTGRRVRASVARRKPVARRQ
jgi:hypothetical protein